MVGTVRRDRQVGHHARPTASQVRGEDQETFEVFWDLTVSPWFADDGSVRGVLAHGVDVTEQTRPRRLRRSMLTT